MIVAAFLGVLGIVLELAVHNVAEPTSSNLRRQTGFSVIFGSILVDNRGNQGSIRDSHMTSSIDRNKVLDSVFPKGLKMTPITKKANKTAQAITNKEQSTNLEHRPNGKKESIDSKAKAREPMGSKLLQMNSYYHRPMNYQTKHHFAPNQNTQLPVDNSRIGQKNQMDVQQPVPRPQSLLSTQTNFQSQRQSTSVQSNVQQPIIQSQISNNNFQYGRPDVQVPTTFLSQDPLQTRGNSQLAGEHLVNNPQPLMQPHAQQSNRNPPSMYQLTLTQPNSAHQTEHLDGQHASWQHQQDMFLPHLNMQAQHQLQQQQTVLHQTLSNQHQIQSSPQINLQQQQIQLQNLDPYIPPGHAVPSSGPQAQPVDQSPYVYQDQSASSSWNYQNPPQTDARTVHPYQIGQDSLNSQPMQQNVPQTLAFNLHQFEQLFQQQLAPSGNVFTQSQPVQENMINSFSEQTQPALSPLQNEHGEIFPHFGPTGQSTGVLPFTDNMHQGPPFAVVNGGSELPISIFPKQPGLYPVDGGPLESESIEGLPPTIHGDSIYSLQPVQFSNHESSLGQGPVYSLNQELNSQHIHGPNTHSIYKPNAQRFNTQPIPGPNNQPMQGFNMQQLQPIHLNQRQYQQPVQLNQQQQQPVQLNLQQRPVQLNQQQQPVQLNQQQQTVQLNHNQQQSVLLSQQKQQQQPYPVQLNQKLRQELVQLNQHQQPAQLKKQQPAQLNLQQQQQPVLLNLKQILQYLVLLNQQKQQQTLQLNQNQQQQQQPVQLNQQQQPAQLKQQQQPAQLKQQQQPAQLKQQQQQPAQLNQQQPAQLNLQQQQQQQQQQPPDQLNQQKQQQQQYPDQPNQKQRQQQHVKLNQNQQQQQPAQLNKQSVRLNQQKQQDQSQSLGLAEQQSLQGIQKMGPENTRLYDLTPGTEIVQELFQIGLKPKHSLFNLQSVKAHTVQQNTTSSDLKLHTDNNPDNRVYQHPLENHQMIQHLSNSSPLYPPGNNSPVKPETMALKLPIQSIHNASSVTQENPKIYLSALMPTGVTSEPVTKPPSSEQPTLLSSNQDTLVSFKQPPIESSLFSNGPTYSIAMPNVGQLYQLPLSLFGGPYPKKSLTVATSGKEAIIPVEQSSIQYSSFSNGTSPETTEHTPVTTQDVRQQYQLMNDPSRPGATTPVTSGQQPPIEIPSVTKRPSLKTTSLLSKTQDVGQHQLATSRLGDPSPQKSSFVVASNHITPVTTYASVTMQDVEQLYQRIGDSKPMEATTTVSSEQRTAVPVNKPPIQNPLFTKKSSPMTTYSSVPSPDVGDQYQPTISLLGVQSPGEQTPKQNSSFTNGSFPTTPNSTVTTQNVGQLYQLTTNPSPPEFTTTVASEQITPVPVKQPPTQNPSFTNGSNNLSVTMPNVGQLYQLTSDPSPTEVTTTESSEQSTAVPVKQPPIQNPSFSNESSPKTTKHTPVTTQDAEQQYQLPMSLLGGPYPMKSSTVVSSNGPNNSSVTAQDFGQQYQLPMSLFGDPSPQESSTAVSPLSNAPSPKDTNSSVTSPDVGQQYQFPMSLSGFPTAVASKQSAITSPGVELQYQPVMALLGGSSPQESPSLSRLPYQAVSTNIESTNSTMELRKESNTFSATRQPNNIPLFRPRIRDTSSSTGVPSVDRFSLSSGHRGSNNFPLFKPKPQAGQAGSSPGASSLGKHFTAISSMETPLLMKQSSIRINAGSSASKRLPLLKPARINPFLSQQIKTSFIGHRRNTVTVAPYKNPEVGPTTATTERVAARQRGRFAGFQPSRGFQHILPNELKNMYNELLSPGV